LIRPNPVRVGLPQGAAVIALIAGEEIEERNPHLGLYGGGRAATAGNSYVPTSSRGTRK
jgi:hypothetical protein